jgi:membrane-associated phospholipid phosphatase
VTRSSVAERVTYLLEPKNWIIATVVAVGWRAGGVTGLVWGLLAAFFAAGLPTLFITRGVARGRWDDRNVGARRPRLIVLAFILTSVTLGLVVLAGLGAPRELTWYFGCMLGSVAVLAAITTVWKISIHCAVASGSATILSLMFGPPLMLTYLLAALTAWSRVELKDHTAAQVIAGSVLGAIAAVVSYAIITRLPTRGPRRGRFRRCSRSPGGCRPG